MLLSLNRIFSLSLTVAAISVLLAGLGGYLAVIQIAAREQAPEASLAVQALAEPTRAWLDRYERQLAALTAEPGFGARAQNWRRGRAPTTLISQLGWPQAARLSYQANTLAKAQTFELLDVDNRGATLMWQTALSGGQGQTAGTLSLAVPDSALSEHLDLDASVVSIRLRSPQGPTAVGWLDRLIPTEAIVGISLEPRPLVLEYRIALSIQAWIFPLLPTTALALLLVLIINAGLRRYAIRALQQDVHALAHMLKLIQKRGNAVVPTTRLLEFQTLSRLISKSGGKMRKERRQLIGMGLTDHLSHLANRRAIEIKLKDCLEQVKTGIPISVLALDVDRFKFVNDTFGHECGDELIRQFAAQLRNNVRGTDYIARLGGDEFCIVFIGADLDLAMELAARLRRKLTPELTLKKDVSHRLHWSGGLSAMDAADPTPLEVLHRADNALLSAKAAGRNRTDFFLPLLHRRPA